MSAAVSIERLSARDVDEVGALEHAIFHEGDGISAEVVTGRLRSDLEGPLMRAWVARSGKRVVGYLVLMHAADEAHVLNVATLPEHRRAGVGRALVMEALAYARAAKVRLLVLEVRAGNRDAIRLYRRVGFVGIVIRRRYYASGEDAVEMHLELDPATGTIVPHPEEVTLD